MAENTQLKEFLQPLVNVIAEKANIPDGTVINGADLLATAQSIPSTEELMELIRKQWEGATNTGSGFKLYIPEGTTRIAEYAAKTTSTGSGTTGRKSYCYIPDIPSSVTNIGQYAFEYCGYHYKNNSTLIENAPYTVLNFQNLTVIEKNAFNNAFLKTKELRIPNGCSVGLNAFSSCKGIEKIVLEEGITTLGENAFDSTSAPGNTGIDFYVPSTFGTSYIFSYSTVRFTKKNCYVHSLQYLLNVQIGGFNSWSSAASAGFTNVKENLYFNNEIAPREIVIPEGLCPTGYQGYKTIYGGFMGNNYFEKITLPKDVEKLDGTFAAFQSGEVIFPNDSNTTTLNYTFKGANIPLLILPPSITTLQEHVFYSFNGTIVFQSETPPTASSWQTFSSFNGKIYVPKGTSATYKAATNWTNIASKIFEPNTITFNVDSSLLNNENVLYSIDGEQEQQFTQASFTGEDLSTLTVTSKSADIVVKVGTTQGGSEIGTVANASTVFTFTSDTTIYITKQ